VHVQSTEHKKKHGPFFMRRLQAFFGLPRFDCMLPAPHVDALFYPFGLIGDYQGDSYARDNQRSKGKG